MKKVFKKSLPLFLAVFSIIFFSVLIIRHEWHLSNSESIYVRLKPVDPRSMIQGDYMALNYHLYYGGLPPAMELTDARVDEHAASEQLKIDYFLNQQSVITYVQLDSQRKVILTSFNPNLLTGYPNDSAKLIVKNPENTFEGLYPAARSFLFAEGLEPCYRDAQFAELKVQANGQPLLAGLVGGNLQALHCEQKQAWWKGPRS